MLFRNDYLLFLGNFKPLLLGILSPLITKAMDQIESNILKMELIEERTEEILTALQKTREVFDREFKKAYKSIYPIPFLSKWMKWTGKHIFRMNYFSRKDLEHIHYIGGLATDFAALIDTKVFEE
jgi:hypothetical protein